MSKQFNPAFDMPETVEQAVAVIASWGSPSVMTFSSQRAKRCADLLQNQTPLAWMRKWAADGVTPEKVRNENGRLAWPFKFKLVPVSQQKCLPDDVALYPSSLSLEQRVATYAELLRSISTAYGAVLSLHTLEKIDDALNPEAPTND